MFALINVMIYDFQNYIENGYVIFNEKISEVGEMESFSDNGYEIIDGTGHVVMPSLTVAHSHIYSTFARGMDIGIAPANFMEILENLWWKLDSHLTVNDIYMSGIVSAVDNAKNGVTTIIDHHASGEIKGSISLLRKAVCDDVGLRGSFCFETSDRFKIEDCITENKDNADMFGLHASMTLSEETLYKVKSVLGDMPIHIHVAESWMDQENCLSFHGERVVERLARHGLLNKNSILSHCIHINENEAELIASNECYVALNVRSNMNNAVGLPDYKMLKDKGVKCLIGNDGMSAGMMSEWSSLYLTMKHRYSAPVAFGMDDLIDIIDNNNKYVNENFGIKVGRLQKGYDADFLSIEYEPPTPMHKDNAFGHILFGMAENFTPEHVWCKGKQVIKHYQVSNELKEKYKEAKKTAAKLWERISGD
ncbi:MAG: amidohydrolase family protein [Clostridiales bacterium]|nr:amidohydrolase family protein [Clostridiales bacterium]